MPLKKIPSSFTSSALKDAALANAKMVSPSSKKKFSCKSSNQKRKTSRTTTKSMSRQKVRSTSRVKSRTKTKIGKAAKSQARMDKGAQDSSEPTALIGPDDYQHIYKAPPKQTPGKQITKHNDGPTGTAMPEDFPTALVAPDDYEHIYNAPESEKPSAKKTVKNQEIPDDAPTVLKEMVEMERSGKGSGQNATANEGDNQAKKSANSSTVICCCRII